MEKELGSLATGLYVRTGELLKDPPAGRHESPAASLPAPAQAARPQQAPAQGSGLLRQVTRLVAIDIPVWSDAVWNVHSTTVGAAVHT